MNSEACSTEIDRVDLIEKLADDTSVMVFLETYIMCLAKVQDWTHYRDFVSVLTPLYCLTLHKDCKPLATSLL